MARYPGFVGPTATERSLNVNAERTINLVPCVADAGLPSARWWFQKRPGYRPFQYNPVTSFAGLSIGVGAIRALFAQDGRAFGVSGDRFVEFFASGNFDGKGIVQLDGRPATISSNGQAGHQLFITSGGNGYIYDLTADTFAQITADGFPSPVVMGGFLNGYFLALQTNSIKVGFSALEDGTAWDALDFIAINQSSDNILAMVVDHLEMWLFGSKKTAVWTGVQGESDQTFVPIGGAFLDAGIIAPFSAVSLDNSLFWLGQDSRGVGMVFRATNYSPQRISTHAVEYQLQRAPRMDDAIGWAYQQDGHTFYVLYVPTLETTWVYDVASQQWHERARWDRYRLVWEPDLGRCHCFAFGKHLVGSRTNGTIYEMSPRFLTDLVVSTVANS